LCFEDRNIFTPSPKTLYRGSNLLHLLELLLSPLTNGNSIKPLLNHSNKFLSQVKERKKKRKRWEKKNDGR
jgi:hypothetical protein